MAEKLCVLEHEIPNMELQAMVSNNPNAVKGIWWAIYGTLHFDHPSLIAQASSAESVILFAHDCLTLKRKNDEEERQNRNLAKLLWPYIYDGRRRQILSSAWGLQR